MISPRKRTRVRIQETGACDGGFAGTVRFDDGPPFDVIVKTPFTAEEEARLEWYFETHPRFPFADQARKDAAAASIFAYGESLFHQVLGLPEIHSEYRRHLNSDALFQFEIVGSPPFHALHWEALKDPDISRPLSLLAQMVRKGDDRPFSSDAPRINGAMNLLLVTARPGGIQDIGLRTVSRPMVATLEAAGAPVAVHILRPGTFRALEARLRSKGPGYYHVVHFDLHGIVDPVSRQSFLLFEADAPEGETGRLVPADDIGDLLNRCKVPLAVLNACSSGKQTFSDHASLVHNLMHAGVQAAIGMRYNLLDAAAPLMMARLYQEMFCRGSLSEAARMARQALYDKKDRRAWFNETIELEDWLLPVVYARTDFRFPVKRSTPEVVMQKRDAPLPEAFDEFVGRDLDILAIERRVCAGARAILIRGMGGIGKTALLQHLGEWWRRTDFIGRVFYFTYNEMLWTLPQILHHIAEHLLGPDKYRARFQSESPEVQERMIRDAFCREGHLLILDNLETIGENPSDRDVALSPCEREKIVSFLEGLSGGKAVALLGSRGPEPWLNNVTGDHRHELRNLDPESAANLADRAIRQSGSGIDRADPHFHELIRRIGGHPEALEAILTNLSHRSPKQMLLDLQRGEMSPEGRGALKEENAFLKIEHALQSFPSDSARAFLFLAPIADSLNAKIVFGYANHLNRTKPSSEMDVRMDILKEAFQYGANSGILAVHPQRPEYFLMHPLLSIFLSHRLRTSEMKRLRNWVETAFVDFYREWSVAISRMAAGKNADGELSTDPRKKRRIAIELAEIEYDNAVRAMFLSIEQKVSFSDIFEMVSRHLDHIGAHELGLILGEHILSKIDGFSSAELSGLLGEDFAKVNEDMGRRFLHFNRYGEAEDHYRHALKRHEKVAVLEESRKQLVTAYLLHQLGRVCFEQQNWSSAEAFFLKAVKLEDMYGSLADRAATRHELGHVKRKRGDLAGAASHYEKALRLYEEAKDAHHMAMAHQNLGIVSQEIRQWGAAERHYKKAVQIYRQLEAKSDQAGALNQMGVLADHLCHETDAENFYLDALKIFIEIGDGVGAPKIHHNLGVLYHHKKRNWSQAERHYRKALEYPDYAPHERELTLKQLKNLLENRNRARKIAHQSS